MFEPLLVLYILGTLLCPPARGEVTSRLVKIITCEKTTLNSYNWSEFVIKELMREVKEYKKVASNREERLYVSGCLYFLMIMFLQNFSLDGNEVIETRDALLYWDDEKIKKATMKEKESVRGILFSGSAIEVECMGPTSILKIKEPKKPTPQKMNCIYHHIMGSLGDAIAKRSLHLQSKSGQGVGAFSVEANEDDVVRFVLKAKLQRMKCKYKEVSMSLLGEKGSNVRVNDDITKGSDVEGMEVGGKDPIEVEVGAQVNPIIVNFEQTHGDTLRLQLSSVKPLRLDVLEEEDTYHRPTLEQGIDGGETIMATLIKPSCFLLSPFFSYAC
ncbi:uncharacterized protein LOC129319383 [Prosopis cineraria]|uniref:uncharacterized protein LOC129319383 n=1 Tax=Prosopis cineraria TaxID=364024 RepID=UPI00240FFD43|nr:uncharacterized protein LOC129319383 [Prosopis cineraria]XP_054820409.1 uncharacterized protein LOC129319383 [Prosopis cineraria]